MRTANWCLGGLLAVMALLVTRTACGQQTLVIPAPNSQEQPRVRPRATPAPTFAPGRVEEIAPKPSPTPAPPPVLSRPPSEESTPAARQPTLPAVFRGCWVGEVNRVDKILRLPGAPPIGPWIPKTYRLCYKRVGDAPFRLTFTETGIEPNRKITNAEGRVEVLSTDGQSYAQMRAYLHFDEFRSRGRSRTFAVDEVTTLDCRIEEGRMRVQGKVYGTHNGNPWFSAHWHATFAHFTE